MGGVAIGTGGTRSREVEQITSRLQTKGRNHDYLMTFWGSLSDQVDELGGTEQASTIPQGSLEVGSV